MTTETHNTTTATTNDTPKSGNNKKRHNNHKRRVAKFVKQQDDSTGSNDAPTTNPAAVAAAATTNTTSTPTPVVEGSTKSKNSQKRERYFKKKVQERKAEISVDSRTLQGSILTKWQQQRVMFNVKKTEEWLNKAPASSSPADILAWAQDHPYLKVTKYNIPQGILPQEYYSADSTTGTAQLIDITVMPPKTRGPRIIDDDIYDLFAHVRNFVPRGLCLFSYKDHVEIAIFAMKKFTGGPGDDDDYSGEPDSTEDGSNIANKPRYEHYFIESSNKCTTLIETSKENGDASHLGQVRLNGQVYYVLGSKNVHLLAREIDHVKLYHENRFMVARQVATSMLKFILSLPVAKVQTLMDYMHHNSLSATLEFLQVDNQHVELFDFNESKFRFIAFTSLKNLDKLCADDICNAVKVAADAGFETVTVTTYPSSEQDGVFKNIRSGYGKEGAVVYYVNDRSEVIGLVKKKTVWYVMVRSIREKMKNMVHRLSDEKMAEGREDYLKHFARKLSQTMKQKQTWLGFSDEVLQQWTALAFACAEWLREDYMKRTEEFSLHKVERMFPLVWYQFLKEKQLNDQVMVL